MPSSPPVPPAIGRPLPSGIDTQARIVLSKNAYPVGVEQYRRLGATLHDLHVERQLKTLMITSALPQDGKTLTAVNLALTLSHSYGRRVLLIDADLRQPSVHTVLGLQNQSGLREALDSGAELPVIKVGPLLTVAPAGRPTANPLVGLTSDAMRSVLDTCEARFDWVLLDAPPVGLLPDAQLLAHLTGAVIFVIRAGVTPFPLVERAIREIGREYILGTVLNGVADDAISTMRYYSEYLGREAG